MAAIISDGEGRVYPRVGGATDSGSIPLRPTKGLSPRGRGNLCGFDPRDVTIRSIPAWAGQPPMDGGMVFDTMVYPRVGGATAERGC